MTLVRVACEFCDALLDPHAPGVHQYVRGWSMNRPKGTHGLSLAVREPRWAHRHCVEDKVRGTFGTRSLFGEEPEA